MDPLWLALSKLRRGKLDECIGICNEILSNNPGDQVKPFKPRTENKVKNNVL
jgi:hypothetical protein